MLLYGFGEVGRFVESILVDCSMITVELNNVNDQNFVDFSVLEIVRRSILILENLLSCFGIGI
jgi:hypothetical protein